MTLMKRKSAGNGHGELARRASEPFTLLQREIDRAFDRMRHAFEEGILPEYAPMARWPAVDISEDDRNVTLRADVPGLEAKDLDVQISGNTVTIRGSREEEKKEEGRGYRGHERRFGSFSRTLTLPAYVDPNKIEARYEKGVLTLTVPKLAGQERKRVAIRSA